VLFNLWLHIQVYSLELPATRTPLFSAHPNVTYRAITAKVPQILTDTAFRAILIIIAYPLLKKIWYFVLHSIKKSIIFVLSSSKKHRTFITPGLISSNKIVFNSTRLHSFYEWTTYQKNSRI